MEEFLTSGRAIDLVLAITAIEALGLIAYHRMTGRGVPPGEFIVNLASGMCLMLALRTALTGGGWQVIVLCLLGAFAAHLADLRRRWHA